MKLHRLAAASALALALLSPTAQAATLAADNQWHAILVDDATAQSFGVEWIDDAGAALHFNFSIDAGFVGKLTVVDTGFSGDEFRVYNGAALLGSTSTAVDGDATGAITFEPVDALADNNFSRGMFWLGAGTHDVTGVLSRSLAVGGTPLNATSGALRLEVSPVPEPASLATLLAGLSLLTVWLRRRGN